ncbi:SpoVA/SpoVAEb family sporulation membrane protein [Anaerolentibacter hominis]|uniref:SpoVA/SpoVAEb family sporulation membrane protein n=1 Tax=Anaerolentibacter hominis TaxID=3079009 RepID=UPI0031B89792
MTDIKEVLNEQDELERDKKYNQYVKEKTPTHNWFLNACKAFLIGGIICTIGQFIINRFMAMGADKDLAAAYNMLVLIFLSVTLTGFNIYPKLAKFGGAGTVVPITGFANSVVAPAIEYQKEGQVFGIGCKIFTIAGPVILYGIFSSWLYGIIYMILKSFGIL